MRSKAESKKAVRSIRRSWESERQAVYLYGILAQLEPHENRRQLFLGLADEAEVQARVWKRRLEDAQVSVAEEYQPTIRVRMVAALTRLLGIRRVLPILSAMKVRGLSVYRVMPGGHAMPPSPREESHRHRFVETGGTLRAAVFGVNDGLVSNTSLILGVAGAMDNPQIVLLSGVAGLLAGACSMAAGEYVSMRSQREVFEYQIGLEKEELKLYPEEEAEELAQIYHARGIPLEEARKMGRALIADPEHALDTLAREELGLNPDDLGSPWGAALFSFLAFSAGGFIPLFPFVLGGGPYALRLTVLCGGLGLFAVGAALSLFTGRGALWSGFRMVFIGAVAGLTTYSIGSFLGVSLL